MRPAAIVSDHAGKVLSLRGKDLLSFSNAHIYGQQGRGGDLRNAQDPPDKSSR